MKRAGLLAILAAIFLGGVATDGAMNKLQHATGRIRDSFAAVSSRQDLLEQHSEEAEWAGAAALMVSGIALLGVARTRSIQTA